MNNKKNVKRYLAFSAVMLVMFIVNSCTVHDQYIAFSGYAQGGTYTVKINLNGKDGMVKERPERIREVVDSLLLEIDNTLSGYNKGSILSRFNRNDNVLVNEMFLDMYERSYAYYNETDGLFDAASAPLFDIWGFGFKKGEFPSDVKVQSVLKSCGMKNLNEDIRSCVDVEGKLSQAALLKETPKGAMSKGVSKEISKGGQKDVAVACLNYNAVAQGYSCDVIAKYLYSIGVKDLLVNIGEIYCDGLNPNGKPWTVGVDSPFDGNNDPGKHLQGVWHSNGGPCGIVTSGNYRKFYIKDGKKYAHTINPVTGYPVQHNLLSATIVAKNATDADTYATFCMVAGLEKAIKFIDSRDDLEGYLIYEKDGEMSEWASSGFALKVD